MPKSAESINDDLDTLLGSHGFEVTPMDSSGQEVPVPSEADIFQFHFHRNGDDYGTVTVTIDGLQKMIVYYDDQVSGSGSGDNGDISWIDLVKQLKKFALGHQLGFELKDTDRLRTDMKRREHTKKLEESWSGIGFDVRSDKLWPAKLFENKNVEQSSEFDKIIDEFRAGVGTPKQGAKCILAMIIRSADSIDIMYGIAQYVDQTNTHYILKNSTGTHQYSKKNQVVFTNKNQLSQLETLLRLKYTDISIEIEQMKVMETSMTQPTTQKQLQVGDIIGIRPTGAKMVPTKAEVLFVGRSGAKIKLFSPRIIASRGGNAEMTISTINGKYDIQNPFVDITRPRPPVEPQQGLAEADEWEEDTEKRERFLQYAKQKLMATKGNRTEIANHLSVQDNKFFDSPFINTDTQIGLGAVNITRGEKFTKAISQIMEYIRSGKGQAEIEATYAALWLQPEGKKFIKRVHDDLVSMKDDTVEARQKHAIALSGYQIQHLGGKVRGSYKGEHSTDPKDRMTREVADIYDVAEMEIGRILNIELDERERAREMAIWDALPMPMKVSIAAAAGTTPEGFKAGMFGRDDAERIGGYLKGQQQYQRPGRPNAQQHGNEDDNIDFGNDDDEDEEQQKLNEGYYGNKKMSYNDDTPRVKMVIKHNKQLEETDQRFRHIERIFLETSDGERFQAPTNKPSRARMFARHIAEGGAYRDERWSHLQEICEDLDALGGFVRATARGREQFNESAQRMISEANEKYQQLRETVKQLSSGRGYNKYFESYQPALITETDDTLSEVFKQSTIDTRIESALPVLSKFGIKHVAIAETSMFENWADSILDEALDPMTDAQEKALLQLLNDTELKVGPNGEVAIAALDDIIANDELSDELRAAAKQDSNNDAVAVIKSWMERQHDPRYDAILDKYENEEAPDPTKDSENKEPAKVKPRPEKKLSPSTQTAPAGDLGALPPLPSLPPLAEDSDFVRMLKLSGI
jgi:hypothetical protein